MDNAKLDKMTTRLDNPNDDPKAYAKIEAVNGIAKYDVRVSTGHHVAWLNIPIGANVKRGDMLEINYRGPIAEAGAAWPPRLEIHYNLGGEGYGWQADNRKMGDGWKRFSVDLFKVVEEGNKKKIEKDEVFLTNINVVISNPPGVQSYAEIESIRISPHVAATVD